jgi:hypothetical protein
LAAPRGWHSDDDRLVYISVPAPISARPLASRLADAGRLRTTFSLQQLLAAILPDKSVTTNYSFIGWLPISAREVLFTYLYAYLWVPFKVFAPLWLLFHFKPAPDPNDGSMTRLLIVGTFGTIWMIYVLVVLTRLLHQTRGGVN